MRSIRATCAAFPDGACQLLGWVGVCCWLGTWWRGLNSRGSSTLRRFSLPENRRGTDSKGVTRWGKDKRQRDAVWIGFRVTRAAGGVLFREIWDPKNLKIPILFVTYKAEKQLFSNSPSFLCTTERTLRKLYCDSNSRQSGRFTSAALFGYPWLQGMCQLLCVFLVAGNR